MQFLITKESSHAASSDEAIKQIFEWRQKIIELEAYNNEEGILRENHGRMRYCSESISWLCVDNYKIVHEADEDSFNQKKIIFESQ